jgi:hypothetical protein
MKQQKKYNGYLSATLFQKQRPYIRGVHRLIMATFVGEADSQMQVCHNNGVKTDNRLENLRYDTQFGNMKDAIESGTIKKGVEVNTNKLSERDVIAIRRLYATGRVSQRCLANAFGVCKSSIGQIVRQKSWQHLRNSPN